jgi:hypothetical protein
MTTRHNFNLQASGITVGNLNLTGNLFQNGGAYASSQWTTGTDGSVSYTSGSVVASDLVSSNFSAGNLVLSSLNLGVSSVFSGSFSASNNVSAATNVSGFQFSNSISSFSGNVMVTILASSNLYENFTVSGNRTASGWNIYISSLGDNSGIEFSITSGGQVQYTSTNVAGFVSSTFRYNVTQISESGTYTPVSPSTSGTYIYETIQVSGTQGAVPGTNNGSLYVLGGATIEKNLVVKETLSALSGTVGQMVSTNFTSGTALITSSLLATGNSNTVGALVTTGGNVGIGTTAPAYKLDINGVANASVFRQPQLELVRRGTEAPSSGFTARFRDEIRNTLSSYLTYNSNSSLGDSMTINVPGVYSIYAMLISQSEGQEWAIIDRNTAHNEGFSYGEGFLARGERKTTDLYEFSVSFTGYLAQNDVVRIKSTAAGSLQYYFGMALLRVTLLYRC